jgi:hypothetical protein
VKGGWTRWLVRRTLAALVLTVVAGPLGCCGGGDNGGGDNPPASAPTAASDAAWTTIATVDGASLARLSLSDGSHVYLQRIDLRRMRVEQVTGDRDPGAAPDAGRYYPGADSPRFIRIPPAQAQHACGTAFSVVNFAFFEEYDRSTRLSFPAKSQGTLLTAGSSPYGPVAAPSDPYYRGVTLQALTWTGSAAAIAPYNPNNGAPLSDPAVVNGLVTYAYRDHPSYVLNHDPPDRFQLLALTDPQHLLILTLEHATLDTGADLLRTQRAAGQILTFDGGISTYLWQSTLGELVPITNRDGALPHYLCVRADR